MHDQLMISIVITNKVFEVTMKSLGIISEFNPFHNGHKYLLDKAISDLDIDISVSIMSGDFVQRGEPAIMDKFTRAKIAINQGFDLIIEMPSFVTLQSAEFFALKSVYILDKLGIDYLVFGIENIYPSDFLSYAEIIINNTDRVDSLTKKYLEEGLSYPKAHNKAIGNFVDLDFLSSNNILALEYLRAIRKINSNIKPYPIRRIKTLNSDKSIKDSNFASSTAIRNNLDKNIQVLMPNESFEELIKFTSKNKNFDENYIYNIFCYKILIENKDMDNTLGYEDGINNYLKKLAKKHKLYQEFLKEATNQRYTTSRIKRLVLNYILDNNFDLNDIDISFIKILAYNNNALVYFKDFNKNLTLIINKKDTNILDLKNIVIYDKMISSSNFYSLGRSREIDFDFKHNNRPID